MKLIKEMIGAAVLCGVLSLTMISATANAAESNLLKAANKVEAQFCADSEPASFDALKKLSLSNLPQITTTQSTVIAKTENGVTMYSTDGGETWSAEAPEGMRTLPEGVMPFTTFGRADIIGKFGTGYGLSITVHGQSEVVQIKIEDGEVLYSTDGGETWSAEAPEGMRTLPGLEGLAEGEETFYYSAFTFADGEGEGLSLQVKIEDGVTLYSTDGGETWSEEAPENTGLIYGEGGDTMITYGFKIDGDAIENIPEITISPGSQGGFITRENGKPWFPSQSEGYNVQIKIENGVVLYSTDGGETWSEIIPEGMTTTSAEKGISSAIA